MKVKTSPYCTKFIAVSQCQRSVPNQTAGKAHLLAIGEKELEGVHSIGDGAADERHIVENDGRLVRVPQQELPQDVKDDDNDEEGGETDGGLFEGRCRRVPLGRRSGKLTENTHGGEWRAGTCRGGGGGGCGCREAEDSVIILWAGRRYLATDLLRR